MSWGLVEQWTMVEVGGLGARRGIPAAVPRRPPHPGVQPTASSVHACRVPAAGGGWGAVFSFMKEGHRQG